MMKTSPKLTAILNENDSLERENEKLKIIVKTLMARVERANAESNTGYQHFERSLALEEEVRERTNTLHEALEILKATNTQLEKAQAEIQKSERILAQSIESIVEGFAIFDEHGTLLMQNSRFLQMLPDIRHKINSGMSFEEHVKISATSKYMILPNNMSSEDWFAHRMNLHAQKGANFTVELANDHWLQVTEQHHEDGSAMILQTDITDHVRRERLAYHKILDQKTKIIKNTLEHITQAVLIFDEENRLIEWNEMAMKLLSLPQSLRMNGTRADRFEWVFQSGKVFQHSSSPENLFHWLMSPSKRADFQQELITLNDENFHVFGQETDEGSVVLSFSDVTRLQQAYENIAKTNENLEIRVAERTAELKAARDSAQIANASKSRFVAAASHDLLQPLNAAKLFLRSLEQSPLSKKQSHTVSRISESFRGVEDILESLLEISKLDSGLVSLQISDFELSDIIEQIYEIFQPFAREKNLDFQLESQPIIVRSDPSFLNRIVQNLISNAIRYTDEGSVSLKVEKRRNHVLIHVEDTGIGISEAEQKLIFKEFHRVKTDHHQAGMGLGLTIVERACQMLQHPLSFQSRLGEGTKFSLAVAYGEDKGHAEHKRAKSKKRDFSLENQLIMIVENDENVLEAMSELIEAWGATPILTRNRGEIQASIADLGILPDVLLVDYQLDNDENGLSLIHSLRAQYGNIPCVLITANRERHIQKTAHENRIFVRYKPVDTDELRGLIRGLCADKST